MTAKILWADDEIDLLKPHILFLTQKGYTVETVNNGSDAVEKARENQYDIIFLDENMPGISGLEALSRIKEENSHVPIVMITKSEEENIMEEAIGSKIADYLIKPVNPNQLLLCLKKNLDHSKLISQKTNSNYQQEFRQIAMTLGDNLDADEWAEMYKKLIFWEKELDSIEDSGMREILTSQKLEANQQFCKFISKNYQDWIQGKQKGPQMIHSVFKDRIAPKLKEPLTFVVVIDNLRMDQFNVLRPILAKNFTIDQEDAIYSILPTATHYARNSFFAGLLPSEIAKQHPDLWLDEYDEGGKNMKEKELLEAQLKRLRIDVKMSYNKITNLDAGKKLVDNFNTLKTNQLNVIVYNFVDMLSHARTEMDMIKELASDESAYLSLTKSWFEHSALHEMFKKMAEMKAKVIVTTDHGTIRVQNPVRIVGERTLNSNLRYKVGRNMQYKDKEVFQVKNPLDIGLPKGSLSSEFIFTRENDFFVYGNNYNQFVHYYGDTFQHGGVSLEEIIIPFIEMSAK